MADKKYVVVPSQYDNDVYYVRQGDGTNSAQDVARILVVAGEDSPVTDEVKDFVEECFKPFIPAWVR